MKQLLFIAFHFPPYKGGSGVHRASKFARYLLDNGWQSHVLTAHSRAYGQGRANRTADIGEGIRVTRAFGVDVQRDLAIRGRYIGWLAIPDRWSNWALAAIPAGLVTIYRKRIDAILATFPIATAVFVGLVLHCLSGKPLIIDFRDSMTEDEYPRDPRVRRVCRWIERSVVKRASKLIFTAKSARQMYLERYPDLHPGKCVVIPNGYDEDDFAAGPQQSQAGTDPIRLVHAGLIYPDDRDPRAFFRAVQRLKVEKVISPNNLAIDLRASGSEEYYSKLLQELEIEDIIHLLPALPHQEALRDTANANGLLLFQAASCDHQIPAKVYEYLRFSRPILALTSSRGDTADLLREVGGATIVELTDEESIYRTLPGFISAVRQRVHPLPQQQKVQRYTRRNGTSELANCLDQIICREVSRVALES